MEIKSPTRLPAKTERRKFFIFFLSHAALSHATECSAQTIRRNERVASRLVSNAPAFDQGIMCADLVVREGQIFSKLITEDDDNGHCQGEPVFAEETIQSLSPYKGLILSAPLLIEQSPS